MATPVKFQAFAEAVAEKKHNLATDTLKVMFTNVAPDAAAHAVKADITEIAAGGGYLAGGFAVSQVSSTQTGGTYKLVLAQTTFTATGVVAAFRYAVVYNDTAASGDLIVYIDYGQSITLQNAGETFALNFNQSNGVVTLA